MLDAAPNVPGNIIERIIQAPVQQRVVRVENPPMNDADLAQIMEALDDEFNPLVAFAQQLAALAEVVEANRGPAVVPADGPAVVPAAVPDQGNDLGLNQGELQGAMEQQQIVDEGGVDAVDEFGLNRAERQAALEQQQFFEQAQREAAQRESSTKEKQHKEKQHQEKHKHNKPCEGDNLKLSKKMK